MAFYRLSVIGVKLHYTGIPPCGINKPVAVRIASVTVG